MNYRDHFFRVLVLVSKNFGLGVKVKTLVTSYSPDLLVGDEIVSSKTGEKTCIEPELQSSWGSWRERDVFNQHC